MASAAVEMPGKRWERIRRFTIPEPVVRLTLWFLLMTVLLLVLLASLLIGGTELWSRVLKFYLSLLLAMIPGWIYLLFIRNKGPSLYDEYVLNLFRLGIDASENLPSPPQHTNYYEQWNSAHQRIRAYLRKHPARSADGRVQEPTTDNLYRKKFEAIYGRGSVSTLDLIGPKRTILSHTETFSPVLFATALICLGWVLVLPPHTPAEHLREVFPGLNFTVLMFAFMGAYAFTLQDLVRRYFRDDLRAGAYLGLVIRIVFVSLVIAAFAVLMDNSPLQFDVPGPIGTQTVPLEVIAFVIGFFPQAGLQIIFDAVRRVLGAAIPTLKTEFPLSALDGLTLWYETRLMEEGIDDMQNLASANMLDLMLKTRAPVARLIDWMDQAILAIHLWPASAKAGAKRSERLESMRSLRSLGIRTATGLERAWAAGRDDTVFCRLISRALGVGEDEGPAVVRSILQGFDGETNLKHIRTFRTHCWLEEHPAGTHDRSDSESGNRAA